MAGIYEAQKMHDAYNKSTKNTGDELSAFENESHTQYYIDQLTTEKIDEQIALLNKPENRHMTNRDVILSSLNELKTKLSTLQSKKKKVTDKARTDTGRLVLELNSPIEFSYEDGDFGREMTNRRYNGFSVPRGSYYAMEPKFDNRPFILIWQSDRQTLHSIVIGDAQYMRQSDGKYRTPDGKEIEVVNNLNAQAVTISAKSTAPRATVTETTSNEKIFSDLKYTIDGKDYSVIKLAEDTKDNTMMVSLKDSEGKDVTLYFKKNADGAWGLDPGGTSRLYEVELIDLENSKSIKLGNKHQVGTDQVKPTPILRPGAATEPNTITNEFTTTSRPDKNPKPKPSRPGGQDQESKKTHSSSRVQGNNADKENRNRGKTQKNNAEDKVPVPQIYADFGLDKTDTTIQVSDRRNVSPGQKILTTEIVLNPDGKKLNFKHAGVNLGSDQLSQRNLYYPFDGRDTTVAYNKDAKTLVIGDTDRQKLVDNLSRRAPEHRISLGDTSDTIKINDIEISLGQARIFGTYFEQTVDIGDAKTEGNTRLNVEVKDDGTLFIVGRTQDGVFTTQITVSKSEVRMKVKNTNSLLGSWWSGDTPTNKQKNLRNNILALLK